MKHFRHSLLFVLYLTLASLFFAFPIDAFGVTTPYWDTHPLSLAPGQAEDINLILQNMAGGEDVTMQATITAGADIATLTDAKTVYTVPIGTKNVLVPIHITIPKKAKEKYTITVSFTSTTTKETQDMLQVATAIKTHIPIVIIEPPSIGVAVLPEPSASTTQPLKQAETAKTPSSETYRSLLSKIHITQISRDALFSTITILGIIVTIILIKHARTRKQSKKEEYVLPPYPPPRPHKF